MHAAYTINHINERIAKLNETLTALEQEVSGDEAIVALLNDEKVKVQAQIDVYINQRNKFQAQYDKITTFVLTEAQEIIIAELDEKDLEYSRILLSLEQSTIDIFFALYAIATSDMQKQCIINTHLINVRFL